MNHDLGMDARLLSRTNLYLIGVTSMAQRDDDLALVQQWRGRLQMAMSGIDALIAGSHGGWNLLVADDAAGWMPLVPKNEEWAAAMRLHAGE